jgi:PhnB protein
VGEVSDRPVGLHTVTPYLIVYGTATLLEFLKEAFGVEQVLRVAREDGAVGHAQLRVGDSMIEVGEGRDEWKPRPCAIHLRVPDADALYRRAITAGASSLDEPMDQPYGDRDAGVEDPSGNHGFIATHRGAP